MIPTTGSVSLLDVATEFGQDNTTIPINNYYAGLRVPSGYSGLYGLLPSAGMISFRQFRGLQRGTISNGGPWTKHTTAKPGQYIFDVPAGYIYAYVTTSLSTDDMATWNLIGVQPSSYVRMTHDARSEMGFLVGNNAFKTSSTNLGPTGTGSGYTFRLTTDPCIIQTSADGITWTPVGYATTTTTTTNTLYENIWSLGVADNTTGIMRVMNGYTFAFMARTIEYDQYNTSGSLVQHSTTTCMNVRMTSPGVSHTTLVFKRGDTLAAVNITPTDLLFGVTDSVGRYVAYVHQTSLSYSTGTPALLNYFVSTDTINWVGKNFPNPVDVLGHPTHFLSKAHAICFSESAGKWFAYLRYLPTYTVTTTWQTEVWESSDLTTWTYKSTLPAPPTNPSALITINHAHVRASRLIVVGYTSATMPDKGYVAYSDDNAATWTTLQIPNYASSGGSTQVSKILPTVNRLLVQESTELFSISLD